MDIVRDLHASVSQGDSDKVSQILLQYPTLDINAYDEYGYPPLIRAVKNGDFDTVCVLLNLAQTESDHGCGCSSDSESEDVIQPQPCIDVCAVTLDMVTSFALLEACIHGHADIVEKLLSYPLVDVNQESNDGTTALIGAVCHHHQNIVSMLLTDDRTDVNIRGPNLNTALHFAVMESNADAVHALFQHADIDVEIENEYDCTPLEMCIEDGLRTMLALLLPFYSRECHFAKLQLAMISEPEMVEPVIADVQLRCIFRTRDRVHWPQSHDLALERFFSSPLFDVQLFRIIREYICCSIEKHETCIL
jgi:Ankyrin repeats (3 copies)/Ankyrin repeat